MTFPSTQAGDIVNIGIYLNSVTNELFGTIMLFTFFVILITGIKYGSRVPTIHAFVTASFITTLISLFMLIIDWIGLPVLTAMIVITAIGGILLYFSR